MELLHGVDEHVEDQVLGRRNRDIAGRTRETGRLGQPSGLLEERQRVGQEAAPLVGDRPDAPRPALLAVELDPQPLLQHQQAAAQPCSVR